MGRDGQNAERVTTSLSRSQKAELERVAAKQGVKVAWLVRRAVEAYLTAIRDGNSLPLALGGRDAQR